jgi:hypothetical protein
MEMSHYHEISDDVKLLMLNIYPAYDIYPDDLTHQRSCVSGEMYANHFG